MRNCLSLLLFLLIGTMQGQTLRVYDVFSQEPIHLVTIQEKGTDNGAVTDRNGMAQLKGFSKSSTLILRHPDYETQAYSSKALEKRDFLIFLRPFANGNTSRTSNIQRFLQYKEDLPQSLHHISRKQIERRNPSTTADLMEIGGHLFISRRYQRDGSAMLRGHGANGLVLVLDGVRLNHALMPKDFQDLGLFLTPQHLQNVEIVSGPNTVLHGTDALGGVVQFSSLKPEFSNTNALSMSTGGTLGISSANVGLNGNYKLSFQNQNFASLSALSYTMLGNLRSGAGRSTELGDFGKRTQYVSRKNGIDRILTNEDPQIQRFSGFDQYNFLQKFRWRLGSFSEFNYSFHYSSSSNVPYYERLNLRDEQGDLLYADSFLHPREWQMHSLQTQFSYPNRFFDQLKLTTAIQFSQLSNSERRLDSDLLRTQKNEMDMLSFNADAIKKIGYNDKLQYGIEAYTNELSSSAYATNLNDDSRLETATTYPSGGSQLSSFSAYLNLQNQLNDRLIFHSGLRYSYTDLEADLAGSSFILLPFNSIDQQYSALNGDLGMVFRPDTSWTLSTVLSTGFRPPNLDDVTRTEVLSSQFLSFPNAGLEPELSYNLEFNFRKEWVNGSFISFTPYFSELRDVHAGRVFQLGGSSEFIYNGISYPLIRTENISNALIWGVSLEGKSQLNEDLLLKGKVTYTQGEDKFNNSLRHVAPLFGELSLNTTFKALKSSFMIRFSDGILFENMAPEEQRRAQLYPSQGAQAWYTLNLYNSYQFNSFYSIHFNIENILDEHYRTYASGISAAGFNAVLTFKASF